MQDAVALVGAGVAAQRIELLDAETVRAVNAYKGTAYAEAPSLFLEFAGGSTESVEGDLEAAASSPSGRAARSCRRSASRRRAHASGRRATTSCSRSCTARPGSCTRRPTSACPVSELPGAIAHARALSETLGIDAAIVAHAGDGNYHVLFMLDPAEPRQLEAAERLNAEIVDWALDRGGHLHGRARHRHRQARLPRARARRPRPVPARAEARCSTRTGSSTRGRRCRERA